MKKNILLISMGLIFGNTAFAQNSGYLTDNSGNIVKSNFDICWNVSSDIKFSESCGDKKDVKFDTAKDKNKEKAVETIIIKEQIIEKTVEKKKIILNEKSTVLFKFDSKDLTESAKKILNDKVVSLNPVSVEVDGHTDKIGTEKYNLKLSKERADSVKDYLVQKGIDEKAIKTNGFGEEILICKESTKSCNQENRRVEIEVEYKK